MRGVKVSFRETILMKAPAAVEEKSEKKSAGRETRHTPSKHTPSKRTGVGMHTSHSRHPIPSHIQARKIRKVVVVIRN